MIAPGKYLVDVDGNGSMHWTPLHRETLENYWQPGAAFTFERFKAAMEERNFLANGIWNLFQTRGNKQTSSHYVKACYEVLFSYGCLPEMSMPKVMEIFNLIGARVNNSRTLSNDCLAECDLFHSVFRNLPEDRT